MTQNTTKLILFISNRFISNSLGWQIAKQLSWPKPLSLTINKSYISKKSGAFSL